VKQIASDWTAVGAIALILSGVNEHNPHQGLCLLAALLLGALSTYLHNKE